MISFAGAMGIAKLRRSGRANRQKFANFPGCVQPAGFYGILL
jgi:hypothetical protein